jgi:hypothetical protein
LGLAALACVLDRWMMDPAVREKKRRDMEKEEVVEGSLKS